MNRLHRGLLMTLAGLSFLFLSCSPAAADNLGDGMSAYKDGNYEKAFELLFPLAQEGNVSAQSVLGTLYLEGQGTAQNVDEARKWFRRAALKGDSSAQFNLAVMHFNGKGGPRDDLMAYKWMLVAWNNGNRTAARHVRIVAKGLSKQEKHEAELAVKDWQPGKPFPGMESEEKDENTPKERKLFVD